LRVKRGKATGSIPADGISFWYWFSYVSQNCCFDDFVCSASIISVLRPTELMFATNDCKFAELHKTVSCVARVAVYLYARN
jgi:hypothetical protein